MKGKIKNKVRYTLFTVVMALIMAFVFGCQSVQEFGFPRRQESGSNDPSNWSQSEIGKKDEELFPGGVLDAANNYAADGLTKTAGVSVLSGEHIKGYKVNDVDVAFEEGSLNNGNVLYDSLLVDGKIFGEKFYTDGIFSNSYFNRYTVKQTYDEEKLIVESGKDIFEYEYDAKGRVEKIFKNIDKNYYDRNYFLYRQYVYSDSYIFNETNLGDPLTIFFISDRNLLNNPFIAELKYPADNEFAGGRIYSFSEEGRLLCYCDLLYKSAGKAFWPKGPPQESRIEYAAPKMDAATTYDFSEYSYAGNNYMTKRTVDNSGYTKSYSYEYINDKMVSETCLDGKNSQSYTITYIFDNAFNRTGFVYNDEIFYYVFDIFGNTEKIIDIDGNTVVKYSYDLFGNVTIDGDEDVGRYNSYTYRGAYDWYYDGDLGFYYLGHDKIFDVKSGSFIKGNLEPEELKNFIQDSVNRTIKDNKAEEIKPLIKLSLTKETIIKQKTIEMAANNLSYENLKSYTNVLVWDHSDFYSSYRGLAQEDAKASEQVSVGRADIYTAPGYSETGRTLGSEVYIFERSGDLSYAHSRLYNLTGVNRYVRVYGEENDVMGNRFYTYTGRISFAGHFIYLDKYIVYKSAANGIVEFDIRTNKSGTYDESLGNLYNFDTKKHVLYYGSNSNTEYISIKTGVQYGYDWEKINKDFEEKYKNDWGGCYVEATCATYYSEEAAAALARNTGGKIYFGGYDLEELKSQMGDDFGFTKVNGQTTVIESKKSKDEFDVGNFIADMALGVGIIVVTSAVIAMTGGSATPFVCFLVTSASLTAVSLAGGALAMGLNMATGGTWQNALNGFSDAFMITAAVSSIAALTTGVGACFVEGTEVKTSKGVKAIENIQEGDLVLSYNEITKTTEYKPVEETFIRKTFEKINIKTSKDDIITTPEHPFYSDGKWTEAKDLRVGDRLQDANGKTVMVEKIQHELLETPLTVYNFRVKDNHNYYVGSGILVHNASYSSGTVALQLPSVNFSAVSGLSLSKALLFAEIAALTIVVGGSISIPAPRSRTTLDSMEEAAKKPRTKEWDLLDYTANGGAMEDQGPWTHFLPATEIGFKLEMDWSSRLNYAQALAYLVLLGVADTAGKYSDEVIMALSDRKVFDEVEETRRMVQGKDPKYVHYGVYTESPSHAMQLGVAAGCGPITEGFTPAPPNSVFYGDGDGTIRAYLVATEDFPGYYHLRGPNDAFRIWTMYPAFMYMAHDGWDVRWLDPRRDPETGFLPPEDSYIYQEKFIWSDQYMEYQEWLLREFEAEHFEWQWWSVY